MEAQLVEIRPGVYFDEARADRAVKFFELLKHTEGQFYGQPFTLLPWQKKIVREVYGTVHADGTRLYRYVYIEMPKKNGKSQLAAGSALYHLFADGERNGEVYSCAADRKQAAIVYKAAVQMVGMVPALVKRAKIRESTKTIIDKTSGSRYEVLSSEVSTKHGFKTSACVFDELHAQPNRNLWDVMTFEAGASRLQPIWWVITTAGDDPDRVSIGWEIHEHAMRILNGDIEDPTWYVVVYSYEGDDIYNEANWYQANPSLGVAKSLQSMRDTAVTAQHLKANERLFRWLDLNQWPESKLTSWMPQELFDETTGGWSIEEQAGKDVYIGQDMSTTTDLSSIVLLWPPQGAQLDWRWAKEAWIPASNMQERITTDHVPYDKWRDAGWVTPTEGNSIDYWKVLDRVIELSKLYKVVELVSDPAFAAMLVQAEMKAGLNVVTVQGTFAGLTDPINTVETLARDKKLTHPEDALARWTWGNASLAVNGGGLKKLVKETRGRGVVRTRRIDPMMALVLAMARARFYESKVDMSHQVLSEDWGM
ncbi:MAG: terminase large subunit [Anaerolineae bacterium]